MLVLPTDWSPKKTSLYLARAETGAMNLINRSEFSNRSWIGSDQDFPTEDLRSRRKMKRRRVGGEIRTGELVYACSIRN